MRWQNHDKNCCTWAKIYGYLIDDSSEDKKAKGTRSVPSKENLNLKIIKTV